MSVPNRLRRPLVMAGVLISLLLGAATIRAAAAWTAASAPLAARPPSIETLQGALATEQARSAALAARLDQLTAGSADLTGAINAARDRITSDAAEAAALRTSLKAAKAKLAALEASIRRARPVTRSSGANNIAPARVVTGSHESEAEGGDGD